MKIEFKTVTYQFLVDNEYIQVRFFRNGPEKYTVQTIYKNAVIYLNQHSFRVPAQKKAILFLKHSLEQNPKRTPID